MALPRLKSIKEKDKTNWRASLRALQFIPAFFKEIRKSGVWMFYINVAFRLINALTPIVILWVGKLIIDEIVIQTAAENTNYNLLWKYVILELGIVVFADIINRIVTLTDGLLGDLYSNASSVKIIQKTNELNVSQLEDAE